MIDYEVVIYFKFSIDNDKNIEKLLMIRILDFFLFYVIMWNLFPFNKKYIRNLALKVPVLRLLFFSYFLIRIELIISLIFQMCYYTQLLQHVIN